MADPKPSAPTSDASDESLKSIIGTLRLRIKELEAAMVESQDVPQIQPHENTLFERLPPLPDFDSSWHKDVQLKWFEVFSRIANSFGFSCPPGALPKFNPEWPQEAQRDWMKIYRTLVELGSIE